MSATATPSSSASRPRCVVCGRTGADTSLGLCQSCFATTVSEVTAEPASRRTILVVPEADGTWELAPGGRLDEGRFTLQRKLGEGGMGDVWLATDHKLRGQPVALKFLAARYLESEIARERLKDEVLQTRRLRHPNIVAVHDWHEPQGEPPFFSMEFVPGANLSQLLRHPQRGHFTWEDLAPLARQWLDALVYAHEHESLVHRDIKPANLLIAEDGRLKVADFGIAQPQTNNPEQTGSRSGTWAFASPQQFIGSAATTADDIYATGASLYELLTGEPPFDPRDVQFEAKLRYETPEPVSARLRRLGKPRLPGRYNYVVKAIAACLEKDATKRPSAQDLRRWLDGRGEPVPPEAEEYSSDWRDWVKFALMLALLLAALGLWEFQVRGSRSWVKSWIDQAKITSSTKSPPRGDPGPPIKPPGSGETAGSNPLVASDQVSVVLRGRGNFGRFLSYDILDHDQVVFHTNAWRDPAPPKLPAGEYEVRAGPPGIPNASWIVVRATLAPPETIVDLDFQPAKVDVIITSPFARAWRSNILEGRVPLENTGGDSSQNLGGTWPVAPTTLVVEGDRQSSFVTNFVPVPGERTPFKIELVPWAAPQPGNQWANSLDMMLEPIGYGAGSFWAAQTETTIRQYAQFADAAETGEAKPLLSVTRQGLENLGRTWRDPWNGLVESGDLPRHPVVGVSWHDATNFCAWLTQKERRKGRLTSTQHYTLPNQAQWTALAGPAEFPWGSNWPPKLDQGNYAGGEFGLPRGMEFWFEGWHYIGGPENGSDHPAGPDRNDGFLRTAPAQEFTPNAHRLHDVGGNAAEWGAEGDSGAGTSRVVRGASWFDDQREDLRTEARQWFPADTRNDRIGFRIILVDGVSPQETTPP